jgi:cystathionine beta-lyase
MPDDFGPARSGQGFSTRMSNVGRTDKRSGGFVNPAVHRGSTVLYANMAERARTQGKARALEQSLIYGLMGTPTHFALEDAIAEIEGGSRCQIVGSGLAAITTPMLAYLSTGQHCLVPDSVYGPTRTFCNGILARLGIATTYYDPCIEPAGLEALLRANTAVLFVESPGSHTFEVQDVPALAEVAHAHGAKVLMDNTWGIHFFQPFRHGVDVSIQAATKYIGGHSDLMLGAVTVNSAAEWERVRLAALELGQYASPDDCWLALRGLRTLAVRLERQMRSGLAVAAWLAERPEVKLVLHPALPGAPGHALWRRDFTGACGLFGVVFQPAFSKQAVQDMVESLDLFGIGASWGGYESLAMPTQDTIRRSAGTGDFGGQMLRLHIGLEEPADLIADLARGLAVLREQ